MTKKKIIVMGGAIILLMTIISILCVSLTPVFAESAEYETVEIVETEAVTVPEIIIITEPETEKPHFEPIEMYINNDINYHNADKEIIGQFHWGDKVLVSNVNDDGWASIIYDNQVIYIFKDFLLTKEEFDEQNQCPVSDEVPLTPELQQYAWNLCKKNGVKYCFFLATIEFESHFTSGCSHKNTNGSIDRGICQVNSCWIKKMKQLGYITCAEDLFDPYIGMDCGMWVLARAVEQYGNTEHAYAWYNTGKNIKSNKNSRIVMGYWAKWIDKLGDI